VGLKLGSDGVLFVSQAHRRNVALAAAEAGVYEAMVALEANKSFNGSSSGVLDGSGAAYSFEVENSLLATRLATVVSTGEYGGTRRTLRVQLEPDSGGFNSIQIAGRIYVFDKAYVNAIVSPSNPISRPGGAHSEYTGSEAGYVGEDLDEDGTTPTLRATGDLTARGFFDSDLVSVSRVRSEGIGKPRYRLNPTEMKSGAFTSVSDLSSSTLTSSMRVTGNLVKNVEIVVPKGVTLWVEGDAEFRGGIRGEGQVVVDGDAFIRTNSSFDDSNEEGLKLYSGESVFLTHPETEINDDGVTSHEFNVVGDFFAQMPLEASSELSIDMPTSAPRGGDFFTWYDSTVGSSDPQFLLWYNGDGTDLHPGLSEETRQWLETSRPIHSQIAAWADD
jgi:hypothetical protein